LKDDSELAAYQTQTALEDASLHVNPNAPPISGDALEAIVQQYNATYSIINRLSRVYPSDLLEVMIFTPVLAEESLRNRSEVEAWVKQLSAGLEKRKPQVSANFDIQIREDTERQLFLPIAHYSLHGLDREHPFNADFFHSGEYRTIIKLGKTLEGLLEKGAFVKRGDKTKEVASFDEAITWLIDDAMKGHYLQRYKGLGEMNPDQLWETTMDPENRRMLQVTIDDAIGADHLFNTLMGDQVDPRREFIEANALAAQNLDI